MELKVQIFLKFRKITEEKTSDGPETAIQQIDAVFDLVNWFAYFVGLEIRNDWKFNLRSTGNMIVNLWFAWVELYSHYLLGASVDCVILSAGGFFTATVRLTVQCYK